MGGTLGHGVGQGSGAQVETWGRQRGHKLYTRENATWAVPGGEWSRAGVRECTECRVSVQETKWKLGPRHLQLRTGSHTRDQ